jgi:hypothetical protein
VGVAREDDVERAGEEAPAAGLEAWHDFLQVSSVAGLEVSSRCT